MTQYQKLRNSSLDTTDLGFLTDTADLPVLGTNETGEIRFLSYENRIFATKNDCSFPVADRFEDFLGLILACGHTDLLCKIPQYTRLRFQRELSRQMRGMKQQMLCNAIQNCFHPTHIADPYGYVQSMAKIPHSKSRQNTTAVQIGSRHWQAQNLQLLDEDVTVEVCIRIPGAQVTAYYDRWETIAADGDAAREKAVTDPFSLQTQIRATASGNPIGVQITEQQHWDPLADNSDAAKETLQRLNLDGEDGWIMLKLLLSTGKRKKKPIRSLVLELVSETVTIPGPQINAPQDDDVYSMTHPVTGKAIHLTVHTSTDEALDPNFLTNPPCYYKRLCYSIDPAMSKESFCIFDPTPNDRLRTPVGCADPHPDPELENAPTAELTEADLTLPAHIRIAYSARHYQPRKNIIWHTAFHCKRYPDGVLPIIR